MQLWPRKTFKEGISVGIVGLVYVCYVLIFSLVPTSMNPRVRLPPFYSSAFSFVFVLFGIVAIFRNLAFSRFRFHRQWTVLAIVLLSVGIIGTVTNRLADDLYSWLVLVWPMLILVGVASLAHWIVESAAHRVERLTLMIAVIVTAIVLVYALASVIAPALGFRRGIEIAFGGDRLRGPIGNAAILHLVFLPTAGYWIWLARQGSRGAWFGVMVNIAGLVLTFSRAGVLSLTLWLAWMVLMSTGLAVSRKVMLVVLLIFVVLALSQVWSPELASRLMMMTSDPRVQAYFAGWRAFSDEPIWGQGFSHVWPWWKRHGELGAGLLTGLRAGRYTYTPYGLILWNPHSLVVLLGAETGLLGMALVLLLFGLPLIRATRNPRKGELLGALLIAIVADSFFAGSFYAFPELSSIWWIYVVSLGVEGPLRASSRQRGLGSIFSRPHTWSSLRSANRA